MHLVLSRSQRPRLSLIPLHPPTFSLKSHGPTADMEFSHNTSLSADRGVAIGAVFPSDATPTSLASPLKTEQLDGNDRIRER